VAETAWRELAEDKLKIFVSEMCWEKKTVEVVLVTITFRSAYFILEKRVKENTFIYPLRRI
jgi:hypothetical protein